MRKDIFDKLMRFLDKLDQGKLSYTLARYRDEAIMVSVAVPGERWEIEFLRDGSIEVERFISQSEIYGEEALDELFARYSDFEEVNSLEIIEGIELMPAGDKS
ncbi:MAG: hypothetical protein DPW09_13475 [Anaerolineae bacterium]|nr:hypothetical protein [Anaerolineales bacterium]MCQ3974450.1 hypothetical protein [Anaerolineae bacterium]